MDSDDPSRIRFRSFASYGGFEADLVPTDEERAVMETECPGLSLAVAPFGDDYGVFASGEVVNPEKTLRTWIDSLTGHAELRKSTVEPILELLETIVGSVDLTIVERRRAATANLFLYVTFPLSVVFFMLNKVGP